MIGYPGNEGHPGTPGQKVATSERTDVPGVADPRLILLSWFLVLRETRAWEELQA